MHPHTAQCLPAACAELHLGLGDILENMSIHTHLWCVCVCVCARARACVCVCVCVCVRTGYSAPPAASTIARPIFPLSSKSMLSTHFFIFFTTGYSAPPAASTKYQGDISALFKKYDCSPGRSMIGIVVQVTIFIFFKIFLQPKRSMIGIVVEASSLSVFFHFFILYHFIFHALSLRRALYVLSIFMYTCVSALNPKP
jgi:hypothetical protein